MRITFFALMFLLIILSGLSFGSSGINKLPPYSKLYILYDKLAIILKAKGASSNDPLGKISHNVNPQTTWLYDNDGIYIEYRCHIPVYLNICANNETKKLRGMLDPDLYSSIAIKRGDKIHLLYKDYKNKGDLRYFISINAGRAYREIDLQRLKKDDVLLNTLLQVIKKEDFGFTIEEIKNSSDKKSEYYDRSITVRVYTSHDYFDFAMKYDLAENGNIIGYLYFTNNAHGLIIGNGFLFYRNGILKQRTEYYINSNFSFEGVPAQEEYHYVYNNDKQNSLRCFESLRNLTEMEPEAITDWLYYKNGRIVKRLKAKLNAHDMGSSLCHKSIWW